MLCCTSALLGPPREMWLDRAATVARSRDWPPVADAVVGRWFTPAFAAPTAGDRAGIARDARRDAPGGLRRLLRRRSSGMDLRDDLPAITAPTLVIAGADDPATPPDARPR